MSIYSEFLANLRPGLASSAKHPSALKLFEHVQKRFSEENIRPEHPLYLSLDMTKYCNSRCSFCCADSIEYDSKIHGCHLEGFTEVITKIQQQLAEFPPYVLALIGGEPLLFPNETTEMVSLANKAGVPVILFSNLNAPLNVTHAVFETLAENPLSFVQTSIDGASKKSYSETRGYDGYECVSQNLEFLKRLGVHVKANVTVSDFNFDEIPAILNTAEDHGVREIHLNPVLPYGRASSKELATREEEIVNAIMRGFHEATSGNRHFDLTITLPAEFFWFLVRDTAPKDLKKIVEKIVTRPTPQEGEYAADANSIMTIILYEGKAGVGWSMREMLDIAKYSLQSLWNSFPLQKRINRTDQCTTCRFVSLCDPRSRLRKNSCRLIDEAKNLGDLLVTKQAQSEDEKQRAKIAEFLEHRPRGLPYSVTWIVTGLCNGNCNFCQVEEKCATDKYDTIDSISRQDLFTFFEGCSCHVQLSGGEPFVRRDYTLSLIGKLKANGHLVSLLTNLVLASKSDLCFLAEVFGPLDTLQVSLYSNDPRIHARMCGRDDYAEVMNRIVWAVELDLPLRVNITVTPDNLDHVIDTVKSLKNVGVKTISVSPMMTLGRASALYTEEFRSRIIEDFPMIASSLRSLGVGYAIPFEVLQVLGNLGYILKEGETTDEVYTKSVPTGLTIHQNGQIQQGFCGFSRLGSLKKNRLRDFFFDGEHVRDFDDKSLCKQCKMVKICQGGYALDAISRVFGSRIFGQCDLPVRLISKTTPGV